MDYIELIFESINNLITIRNTKYNKIFNMNDECIMIDNQIKDDIILLEKYIIINKINNIYVKKILFTIKIYILIL